MTAWKRTRVRLQHPARLLLWTSMTLGVLVPGLPGRAHAQTHALQHIVNEARAVALDQHGHALEASGRAETPVDLLAHTVLGAGQHANLRPGTSVEFVHVLANQGNYTESFTVTLQATAGWSAELRAPSGAHAVPASFEVGPLAPGDSTTLVLRVQCPTAAHAGDRETVTLAARALRVPQAETRVTDEVRCVLAELDPFHLSVEPAGSVPPGARLTYRLDIGNPDVHLPLENLVLEDRLDPAIAEVIAVTSGLVADTSTPGRTIEVDSEFDAVGRVVTWRCASLPPGCRAALTLVVRVAPSAPAGAALANEVTASATGLPPVTGNATANAVVPPALELRLTAQPADVEPGDVVLYFVEAVNRAAGLPLDSVQVDVHLPPGFRFVANGTRDLHLLAPHLEPGTTQSWTLPGASALTLASGDHVAAASARCNALGNVPLQATSQAPVHVVARLAFEGSIVGRVYVDDDDSHVPGAFEGLPGVRLLLEDGTQTITDARGRFHLEGVRPGLHVLRLDAHDLPRDLRFDTEGRLAAGSAWTRFVDVGPSELRKVNFRARPAPGPRPRRYEIAAGGETWRFYEFSLFAPNSSTLRPAAARLLRGLVHQDSMVTRTAQARYVETAGDEHDASASAQLLAMQQALTDAEATPAPQRAHEDAAPPAPAVPLEKQVLSMTPEAAILSPARGSLCTTDHPSVLVKFPLGCQPRLFLNGREVSEAQVGMRLEAPAQGLACWRYVGVGVQPGDNCFVLECSTAAGAMRDTVRVALPGSPARIELTCNPVPADGEAAPRLRVRVLDAAGHPALGALFVTVEPEDEVVTPDADAQRDGLQVHLHDGETSVELVPGTRAATRHLEVRCDDIAASADVTLRPAPHDWLVTGVGALSLGARGSSSALLPGETPGGIDAQGGVFAEGRVGQHGQLTVALDGDRQRDALFGTLEDDRLFPAWGDAAGYTATAPSTWPLFARLDMPSLHAQLGDFRTGWNDLELARFDRALTGFDGGWSTPGGGARVQGFAAAERQSGCRDDLPGRGIAGPYVLTRRPIRIHSERLMIETRDRFHAERIVASRALQPDADSTLDAVHGLIYLKDVLPSTDASWNPMRLVVLYEAESDGPQQPLAGVRAACTPVANLRTGFLGVHESSPLGARTLVGGDAAWTPIAGTTLSGEYARSTGTAIDGAWRATVESTLGAGRVARFSYRDIGPRFDNPTGPAAGDIGVRRYGLDARAPLGAGRVAIDAVAQHDLRSGSAQQRVAADYARDVHGIAATFGYRLTHASVAADDRLAHVLAWQARRQLHARLGVEAGYQQALGAALASDPTRLSLGADVGVTSKIGLRVRQEWDGSATGRRATALGIESRLGERTTLTSGVEELAGPGGDRTSARLGLRTTVALGRGWSVRGSLEHGRVLTEATETSTALSCGATWHDARRLATFEFEHAAGPGSTQNAVRLAGSARLGGDWMLLGRERFMRAAFGAMRRNGHDLLLGWAYRPLARDEIQWLTSVRYLANVAPVEHPGIATARWVIESQASTDLGRRWTLLGGLGVRRSVATAGADGAGASALLAHARLLCDLAPRFDVSAGVRQRSVTQGAADWSAGLEAGYRIAKDVWLAAGYNFLGFADPDFPDRERTAAGGFAALRVKFDERSLGITP